ncbi:MAG TPA: hypothetical protein VN255_15940, partial [Mycobacterium sp.]|nr:hypothetical protein [Mycobacterium sp.]
TAPMGGGVDAIIASDLSSGQQVVHLRPADAAALAARKPASVQQLACGLHGARLHDARNNHRC